jgi:hypothetical protein
VDNPAGKPDGRIMHRPQGFPQGLSTGFPDFTHIKINLPDAAGGLAYSIIRGIFFKTLPPLKLNTCYPVGVPKPNC